MQKTSEKYIRRFFHRFPVVSVMIFSMNKKEIEIVYQKRTKHILYTVADDAEKRMLICNKHIQSAVYLDQNRRSELIFPYMQRFSYAFQVHPEIQKTLLIGGGAFSYPRYYLVKYPQKQIDVVEIDPEIISIAESFFDLAQCRDSRMRIIQDNGFSYLQNTQTTYDLIINDAFTGSHPEGVKQDSAHLIHKHLNPDGIYLINAAVSIKGIHSQPYHRLMKVLKNEFHTTAVMQCEDERSVYEKQNILIAASDRNLF